MVRILAISSQVARGAVGLSAVVPALQALGHEVIGLPTILLSNHPGHPLFAGERIAPALLERMLDALAANGWLAGIEAVLTGYLPSAEHVAFARRALERVRGESPAALYVCDPVLGDEPKGLYIAPEAAEAIAARLVPAADVLKMNRFECSWLGRVAIDEPGDVARLAGRLAWPAAIVTSLPAGEGRALQNVLCEAAAPPLLCSVPRRSRVPNGTGDLFGALYLGHRLGPVADSAAAFLRAVEGVELVLGRSEDADELQLVACLGGLRR